MKKNVGLRLTRHIRSLYSSACKNVLDKDRFINAFVSTSDQEFAGFTSTYTTPITDLAIAVKDNICTKSLPVTCSSAMLRSFTSPFDATAISLLQQSGVRVVGKTNCDEFGMGTFNVHSVHGTVINPHQTASSHTPWAEREQRSAGGSSGGSAAAVAAGLCDAALSTDTGGSTRLPASYCGIVGLKPSYGMISRWGVISYADSLDCVGIMARDTSTVSSLFRVLAVPDEKDPTSARQEARQESQQAADAIIKSFAADEDNLDTDLNGLVVGVPQEYFPEELDVSTIKYFAHLVKDLRSRGAEVVSVSLPTTRYALSAYYVIASAEASSNLARYTGVHYGTREELPSSVDRNNASKVYAHGRSVNFGQEVQKRILLGTYALTADAFDNYFLQAQKIRNLVHADFDNVFYSSQPSPTSNGVHVLIHPTSMRTAPLLSEVTKLPTIEAYVQDVLTVPASLAGLPALSVPAGFADDGWPLGVSVVGKWGHDELVLHVGNTIQHFTC